VIEFFTDLDQMHDEELGFFEPRPWHQDRPQRPKVWGDGTLSNWWGPMSQNPSRDHGGATKPATARAAAKAPALARAQVGATRKVAARKKSRQAGKPRR